MNRKVVNIIDIGRPSPTRGQKGCFCCFLLLLFLASSLHAAADEWLKMPVARTVKSYANTGPAISIQSVADQSWSKVSISIPGLWKRSVTANMLAGKKSATAAMDSATYSSLVIPDCTAMQTQGAPAVPLKILMIPLPFGATPTAVEVVSKSVTTLADITVIPAQPPVPDVIPEPALPFTKDAGIYQSDEFYPANNIVAWSVEAMRDQRWLLIEIAPARAQPADQTVEVAYELELRVRYAPADASDISVAVWPAVEPTPPVYGILMDDQFASNAKLAQFIDWKKRKGYDVRVIKTSDIDPGGAPTNGLIVAYMRALVASNYPLYMLIIGDHDATNGVQGTFFSTSDGGWTDFEITRRDTLDNIQDMFCGRLPASNNTYLSNMLAHAMTMDRTLPATAMYQKACFAGQIQDSDDLNNEADRLFCETLDSLACYFEQDAGGVDYTCSRAIINPQGMTASGTWNTGSILWNAGDQIGTRVYNTFMATETAARTRLIDNINGGLAVVLHRDHGYSGGYGWADPDFQTAHVNALTNANNLPTIFSINCASGAYHQNRFLRAWFQNTKGGAASVFAPVDISYSWHNDWLTHGFFAAFLTNYITWHNASVDPNWPKNLPAPNGTYGAAGCAERLGEVLMFAKLYYRQTYSTSLTTPKLFHLFGDPEAYLQLATPATLSVTHSAIIYPGAQTLSFNVGQAGRRVALYSQALGIHQVKTSTNSVVAFSINPAGAGTICVTVNQRGYRPYEGTVSVALGTDPFWIQAFALTNRVVLRWPDPRYSGMGDQTVRIRARTDTYPTNAASDGALVYEGTDRNCTHTDVTPNQPQYYTIWVSDNGTDFIEPPR